MVRGLSYDIVDGLSSSTAVKGPVLVATTANVTLAGEQTIDGVLTAETRVLVKDQADPTENGIWRTSSGDWTRTKDFSRNDDVKPGTIVNVTGGSTNSGIWTVLSEDDPVVIGTSEITFEYFTSTIGFITSGALTAILASYAMLASPVFTGNPRAPTPSPGDNDTSIATTAFVAAAITALINAAPGALDTLDELAAALGDDANFATTMTNSLAACLKNNVADQTITGGARVTSLDLGTPSAASTVTLDPGDRPLQHLTNNAAFTLAPGSNAGIITLDITNGASAGAITTSGFTKVVGAFTTTNAHKFRCSVSVGNAGSLLSIQPLQ